MKTASQTVRAAISLAAVIFGFTGVSSAMPPGDVGSYKTKCAVCHGADGKAATAVGKDDNIRDLGSADVQAQSDAALTAIITNGKDKMPAYGKSLKPAQITAMVAYVRSLASK